MGRVMIERPAPRASRDADIRTYPVKAGESVRAGDVVDVVGGSVGAAWQGKANTNVVFESASTSVTSLCALKDKVSAVCYVANGSIATRGIKISEVGAPTPSSPSTVFSGTTQALTCDRINDSNFVVGFVSGNLHAKICSYSGAGTVSVFADNNIADQESMAYGEYKLIALSGTSILALYSRGGLKAKACPVSGATISKGTEYALPGSTSVINISAIRLPDSGSNRRVCVCYSDGGDGNKGKAVIATISSANVVTWGTPVVFDAGVSTNLSCSGSGEGAVVSYIAGSILKAAILSVSGNTITALTPITIGPGAADATSTVNTGDSIAISYVKSYSPASAEAVVLTRSGNTLSAGTPYVFNQARANYLSGVPAVDGRILLCYQDAGNSNYGIATMLEVRGNQISGSFENVASQVIALQSGTGGQSIDVIFDGTAELPGITAGTSITSPGVQGYSPQDGWLWVKPEWDRKPFVTGNYLGDGTNGRIINVGFTPSLVIVIGGIFGLCIKTPISCAGVSRTGYAQAGWLEPLLTNKVVPGGFEVSANGDRMNEVASGGNPSNYTYQYIAFE